MGLNLSVLPLCCHGLSFNESEDMTSLIGLSEELHETILSWHLPECEFNQCQLIVRYVLSKRSLCVDLGKK